MIDNQIKTIIEQIRDFRSDYKTNEQAVRTQLIEPILNTLGWITYNPKYVKPNSPNDDGNIPDYKLMKDDKAVLVLEAKNLSVDLQDSKIIDQLVKYCYNLGIDFGILSNGVKWLLFKTFEKNPKDRIIWEVDLEADKLDEVVRKLSMFSYIDVDYLDKKLKTNKKIDECWDKHFPTFDSVVDVLAKQFLNVIKQDDKKFEIDKKHLDNYIKNKINDFYNNEDDYVDKNEVVTIEDSIYKKRKSSSNIKVKFPDNTIIYNKKAVDTFVETLTKIGIDRILNLNVVISGVPLISVNKHETYQQYFNGKYYIMTNTSTSYKFKILDNINNILNIGLVIDIEE